MKDRRAAATWLGASLFATLVSLSAQTRPLSSADASDLAAGKRIFDAQCAWCHGTDGTGGAGPMLQRSDLRHAAADADLLSIDRTIDGRSSSRVAMANRNGFFYLLDRVTGEFILARQYAKQTWAKGIDPAGRPILMPGMEPSEKGTLVYPSLQGATNWASPRSTR